jgi:DUF4097 and DUF4098 domain-containing protein YvlB
MSKKTVVTLVLIFLAVFIVFGIITNLSIAKLRARGDNLFSSAHGEYVEVEDSKSIDLSGVDRINIEVVSSDVTAYKSDGELDISLKTSGVSSDQIRLLVDESGSTVNIKVEHIQKFMNFGSLNSKLDVGIPSDFDGEIMIDTVSGDIKSEGALNNSLVALEVDTTSGDIDIRLKGIGELDAKTVSGDIDIMSDIVKSLRVNSTSGDLDISNVGEACSSVYAKTVSGRVSIAYKSACETEIKTTSGDINIAIVTKDAIDLEYKSTSGDMKGNVNMNDDGVDFSIRSTSGDLNFE